MRDDQRAVRAGALKTLIALGDDPSIADVYVIARYRPGMSHDALVSACWSGSHVYQHTGERYVVDTIGAG